MVILGKDKAPVESFSDISKSMNLSNRVYRGIRPVPVEKIIGSVGRGQDLLPGFRLKQKDIRYYRIRKTMERGEILPPVILYKVGDEYYVLDGNHRVVVAKEIGITFLDAEIVEFFPTERKESPTLRRKRLEFEAVTGLRGIDAKEHRHYDIFLNHIKENTQKMEIFQQRPVSLKEAAFNWFLCVYTPAVQLMVEKGLEQAYPGESLSDIFAYVMDYKWYRSQKEGKDIGFEAALEGFLKEIMGQEEPAEEKKSFMKKVEGMLEEVLPWLKKQ